MTILTRTRTIVGRALQIAEEETGFARRRFSPTTKEKQAHLEGIGRAFVNGYNMALTLSSLSGLAPGLDEIHSASRGFAYEGAGMALALTDNIWGFESERWNDFLEGEGKQHRYMLFVGYGWAAARLPWLRSKLSSFLAANTCIEKWLVYDGYGFHEGYFHWPRTIVDQRRPQSITGSEASAFDQGLGRSLWFFCGADVERVSACISGFSKNRQADLWSGVGLAATYAGGASANDLTRLLQHSGEFLLDLAQGCVFAAEARVLADCETRHTRLATEILCSMTPLAAAGLTYQARGVIPRDLHTHSTYQQWREETRNLIALGKESLLTT